MPRSLPPFAVQLAAALGELIPTFIAGLHGRLGDRVYKTYRRRGQVRLVVTRVPDFSGYTPTAAQRTQRDRMRAATAYAQRVYADPAAKALYTAAAHKLGRCAFRLAISDYLSGRVRVPEAALVSLPVAPRAQPPTEHACGCRAGSPNPAGLGAAAASLEGRPPCRPPHRPTKKPLPRITPILADSNLPRLPPMPTGRDVSPRRPPCVHVRRPLLRGRLGEPSLPATSAIAGPPPRRARSVCIRGDPRPPRSRSSPSAKIANARGFAPTPRPQHLRTARRRAFAALAVGEAKV